MIRRTVCCTVLLVVVAALCTAQSTDRFGDFVLVAGGTFAMGSGNGNRDELPVHEVSVGAFYISRYEVTQSRWVELMGKNPSLRKGDDLPVNVNWFDAVAYCNRLSESEGLTPCYSGTAPSIRCDFTANGYRLPTEAEWEYAARGGKGSRGYLYSGSDSAELVAWSAANSEGTPKPVGRKEPNELGLYDMSGNVYEWCWDWYGAYLSVSTVDPTGPTEGIARVIRGGSYECPDHRLRACARRGWSPRASFSWSGFRPVRSAR